MPRCNCGDFPWESDFVRRLLRLRNFLGPVRRAACGLVASVVLIHGPAGAAPAVPATDDPVLEARVQRITSELRCLVCQNQTIADSHASLADDLRREVRDLIRKGAGDDEIKAYMVDRYGDFVLYRPPVKATTVLLWAGPALILLMGGAVLVISLRRRSRRPAEDFDEEDIDSLPMSPLR
jgi:cytochrome c-type biogenesis protein CcmH